MLPCSVHISSLHVVVKALTYVISIHFQFVVIIGITSPPQPLNIALNRTAEFNCTFIGDIIIWEANRTQIVNDIMGYLINTQPVGTQPTRMSTLTAFASLDKNNTNITCVAISAATLMGVKSEPAVLHIQGEGMCTYA